MQLALLVGVTGLIHYLLLHLELLLLSGGSHLNLLLHLRDLGRLLHLGLQLRLLLLLLMLLVKLDLHLELLQGVGGGGNGL